MRFSTPIPNVEGELTYLPDQQVFWLTMENMPAAPPDHVYQVWLIDGSRSIPCGVMDQSEFVVAEESTLDLARIPAEHLTFDAVGHYGRPDVFTLTANTAPQTYLDPED